MLHDDAGGRRNQRRTGGGHQDDGDYGSSRPSAPATLFDFVTSKMPQNSSLGTLPLPYFSADFFNFEYVDQNCFNKVK